jgi:hypothetical protein
VNKYRLKYVYWADSIRCLLEEFLMGFDEKFLKRCGVCRRKTGTGHKMDCYREYTRNANKG